MVADDVSRLFSSCTVKSRELGDFNASSTDSLHSLQMVNSSLGDIRMLMSTVLDRRRTSLWKIKLKLNREGVTVGGIWGTEKAGIFQLARVIGCWPK
jgi:hypothetical protein